MGKATKKRYQYCHICGPTEKTVFRFPPTNCRKREKWLSFCKKKEIGELRWPYLCYLHFDEQFVVHNARSIRLAVPAVPTREPPEDSIVSENGSDNENECQCPRSPSTSIALADEMKERWNALLQSAVTAESISSPPGDTTLVSNECIHQHTDAIQIESTIGETSTPAQEGTTPDKFSNKDTDAIQIESTIRGTSTPAQEDTTPDKISNNEAATPCHRSTTPRCKRRINPRTLGDINTPLLESPFSRNRCLAVIRDQNRIMKQKVKRLKEQNKRLTQRISSMQKFLNDLKKNGLISEHASEDLLVR